MLTLQMTVNYMTHKRAHDRPTHAYTHTVISEEEEEETLFVNGIVTVGAVYHNNKTVNTIAH